MRVLACVPLRVAASPAPAGSGAAHVAGRCRATGVPVAPAPSIAFVRQRNGYGRIMIRRNGRIYGPLARLGYQLGYYGHHDRGLEWRR